MNTIDCLLNRRSIRKYKDKQVPKETIDKILEAAMYAPSARNLQPWHFVVISKRDMLDKLSEVHPYAKMLKEAPVAILVCGDQSIDETVGYLSQNCAAATQNILLAAHELGLGSVWLGVYPREPRILAMKELFNLPEHILPISLIVIGYSDEEKTRPDRVIAERIHYEKW
jgi:nitroreductase